MDKVEQFNHFNFLKGGIVYSDILTTVSRKYAEEIQTAEFGEQLEGVLKARAADLRGILNGVDYAQWDPATDGTWPRITRRRISEGSGRAARIFYVFSDWRQCRRRRR